MVIQVNCRKTLMFEHKNFVWGDNTFKEHSVFVTFYQDPISELQPAKYHTDTLFDVRARSEARKKHHSP
jgi:hypothetical protein